METLVPNCFDTPAPCLDNNSTNAKQINSSTRDYTPTDFPEPSGGSRRMLVRSTDCVHCLASKCEGPCSKREWKNALQRSIRAFAPLDSGHTKMPWHTCALASTHLVAADHTGFQRPMHRLLELQQFGHGGHASELNTSLHAV